MTKAGDSVGRFELATATRILFGPGTLREVGALAKRMGSRVLVVTGRTLSRAEPLLSLLDAHKISCVTFPVAEEPSVEGVCAGVQRGRAQQCELVIGFGGGSALDAGKAIAAMLTNSGELLEYLEVIGTAKPLEQPSAPFIAIPTTAGTGTEVTRNAVLSSPAHRLKVSLRSPFLLPRLAVIDPELTYGLPPAVTAHTGLDALTQLIEPYVCTRANPVTDAICGEGLRRVARSLRRAYEHSQSSAAREPASANPQFAIARQDMALASLLGGLALANAGLGAVHGFANPIGGMFPVPHGAVCAALLPHVMEINIRALRARAPGSDSLLRYDQLAGILTGNPNATADEGVIWVRDLCADLQIAPLRAFAVTEQDFPALVEKAERANSMKSNPIVLSPDELREILVQASFHSLRLAGSRRQLRLR